MSSAHRTSRPFSFQQANGIAYQALSQTSSISSLARQHKTSRQTVRKERNRVRYLIDKTRDGDEVLSYSFIRSDKISKLMKSMYCEVEEINKTEKLSSIKIGSQDELYHQNKPVLTGIDNKTLYTYLL